MASPQVQERGLMDTGGIVEKESGHEEGYGGGNGFNGMVTGLYILKRVRNESDSLRYFLVQNSHIKQEQGECVFDKQLKQNCKPPEYSFLTKFITLNPDCFLLIGTLF